MRTLKLSALCVLAVLLYPCVLPVNLLAQRNATLEGTVQLPKMPPPPKLSAHYLSKIPGEVGQPDPFAAVVYVEGVSRSPTTNRPVVKIEQKHFQFAPGIIPIEVGTLVEFPNLDEGYHNVFSYSKTRRFDLGRYRKDEKPAALVFDKPGVVKLYCEIHEHMRGTILVLDTPYFVKTDPAGHYRLEHLPSGTFKLKVWLDEKRIWEKPVELKDGVTTQVDFPGT